MQKLAALTTLRFFAAAVIVLFHLSEGACGITPSTVGNFAFAVSFFFILSGFILTYVYPTFENWEARKKFYIARFARIWPAHLFFLMVAFFLIYFNLMHGTMGTREFFFNIFLIQAWVPYAPSYFSFNAPSWSISTEFFFYICFPFLVTNWSKTWHWKAFIILLIPCSLMWMSTLYQLPNFIFENKITSHALLLVNPLSRLLEFFLGIAAAKLWLKYHHRLKITFFQGTLLELSAITLLYFNFREEENIRHFFSAFIPNSISYGFSFWTYSGIFLSLAFIVLIMIIASEKGLLAKILSHRLGVFLGEISFSIYLFHQIVYRFYTAHLPLFHGISKKLIFVGYWSILLLGSIAVFKYIECPVRKWILKRLSVKSNSMHAIKTESLVENHSQI